MPSEKELKKKIKEAYYEGGKRPSHKRYLIALAIVVVAVAAIFILFPVSADRPIPVNSQEDVGRAVGRVSDTLGGVRDTLGGIGQNLGG